MLDYSEKWSSGRTSGGHSGGESFESVYARSFVAVNLHNFTAFHGNIMYANRGEKKQLFTAYLTYFSVFFSQTGLDN